MKVKLNSDVGPSVRPSAWPVYSNFRQLRVDKRWSRFHFLCGRLLLAQGSYCCARLVSLGGSTRRGEERRGRLLFYAVMLPGARRPVGRSVRTSKLAKSLRPGDEPSSVLLLLHTMHDLAASALPSRINDGDGADEKRVSLHKAREASEMQWCYIPGAFYVPFIILVEGMKIKC